MKSPSYSLLLMICAPACWWADVLNPAVGLED